MSPWCRHLFRFVILSLPTLSKPPRLISAKSYMFYQLKWFDPTLPDSVIASQAGMLSASFTAAQFLTAMMWGRIADSSRFGRKTVLMIGLGGTSMSCTPSNDCVCLYSCPAADSVILPRVWFLYHILAGLILQVSRRHHQWQRRCYEDHVSAKYR